MLQEHGGQTLPADAMRLSGDVGDAGPRGGASLNLP
jgi:hypothetical protein